MKVPDMAGLFSFVRPITRALEAKPQGSLELSEMFFTFLRLGEKTKLNLSRE